MYFNVCISKYFKLFKDRHYVLNYRIYNLQCKNNQLSGYLNDKELLYDLQYLPRDSRLLRLLMIKRSGRPFCSTLDSI